MNRVKIREVTALDKHNVLSMRDSADVILDTLPALYDYYSSIPNAYIAGVFYDENLAGALVGHIGRYIRFVDFEFSVLSNLSEN